jgi:hypothetical protein
LTAWGASPINWCGSSLIGGIAVSPGGAIVNPGSGAVTSVSSAAIGAEGSTVAGDSRAGSILVCWFAGAGSSTGRGAEGFGPAQAARMSNTRTSEMRTGGAGPAFRKRRVVNPFLTRPPEWKR